MKPLSLLTIIIGVFFYLSTSCIQAAPTLVQTTIYTDSFSKLMLKGPLNVVIQAKQSNSPSTIQIVGDVQTVSQVVWKANNHTVSLGMKWNYRPHLGDYLTIQINTTPSQLKQILFESDGNLSGMGLTGSLSLRAVGKGCIKLYTNRLDLQSLFVKGRMNILVENIASTDLKLNSLGKNTIRLKGDASVKSINAREDGQISIDWVNSPYLKITAGGSGNINLVGLATNLEIQLAQKTHLFAKDLQASNGFIKTTDQAYAEIRVRNKLNILTKDESRVSYSQPVRFLNTYANNTSCFFGN